MNKLVISWIYHLYMYIYNFLLIILSVCVSYDTIHDIEKLKIDSRYNSRFDNYA